MKKVLLFSAMLFCFSMNAQEVAAVKDTIVTVVIPDTAPTSGGLLAWFDWAVGNWDAVFSLLLSILWLVEVGLRVIPTKGDYTIVTKIRSFLESVRFLRIFKNRAVGGGEFVTKVELKK